MMSLLKVARRPGNPCETFLLAQDPLRLTCVGSDSCRSCSVRADLDIFYFSSANAWHIDGADVYPADEAAEEPIATYGNAADGNLVIEASNTTGIFRDLTQIPDGDALCFTDVTGAVYSYHVLTVETIENDDVSALRERSDEWDLTLAAPSFSGQQKTLLRCAADS